MGSDPFFRTRKELAAVKKTGLTPFIYDACFPNHQGERATIYGANENWDRPVFSIAKRGGCRQKNGSDPDGFGAVSAAVW
jgi:hypothetical protein